MSRPTKERLDQIRIGHSTSVEYCEVCLLMNEIDALEKERNEYKNVTDPMHPLAVISAQLLGVVRALRDENEKLRTALDDIAQMDRASGGYEAPELAREALK